MSAAGKRHWPYSCADSDANTEYRQAMRDAIAAYRAAVPPFYVHDEAAFRRRRCDRLELGERVVAAFEPDAQGEQP